MAWRCFAAWVREGEGSCTRMHPSIHNVYSFTPCLALPFPQVPFRDNAFDAALCIAVLHHLSTEAHRSVRVCVRAACVGRMEWMTD